MFKLILTLGFLLTPLTAYAVCPRTFAMDDAKVSTMVHENPGLIGAKSIDPIVIAAINKGVVEVVGAEPTNWSMPSAKGMIWLMTPTISIIFWYDGDNCFLGSAKVVSTVITVALKAVADTQPHLEPNGLKPYDLMRWGKGSYLRLI